MEDRVELIIDGKCIKLKNRQLSVTFDENARIVSMQKNGVEFARNLDGAGNDPDRHRTGYLDYHAEGAVRHFKAEDLRILQAEKEVAHVAYYDFGGLLALEYHIILHAGESGIYSYVIAANRQAYPIRLSELRTVYRFDRSIFGTAYTSERQGKQPCHAHLCQGQKIQDETFRIEDGEEYTNGKIYSKYDYAGYFRNNPVWGHYGEKFGFWMIPASTEYYPSGPLKQELLVHYDAILLNYMTGAHFGTGDFFVQPGWQKLYGPWMIYVNAGKPEQTVADAQQKAVLEQKRWPYLWMEEKLYPLQRATVKGNLQLPNTVHCMVSLAAPGIELIRQKAGYIFSAETDDAGNFILSNVRPGEYTLYAYALSGDFLEEFRQPEVMIVAGENDLGSMTWPNLRRNHKLWQIGNANRCADEYKYGRELRNYKWHDMVPEELDFIIGESNIADDWYYAQTKNGQWRIHFQKPDLVLKRCYLSIALAAFSKGRIDGPDSTLRILLNGKEIKALMYLNDQAIYRSAMQSGWYHLAQIEFDASSLSEGENIISLVNDGSAIMYDTILLEAD